ncbi:MAG: MATE family efflux transporter, partial [Oscillospiraceae bacterium]|nr:MATE family efflux transporter [Oscillospiraceae bacterium]
MKKDMTTGKEWKLILLFTLPIMAGNLLQQLYNTVDGIIVGQFVSEGAFSAVSTCQPLTFLFLAVAMGLSIGVGIVVSQYFGAGKHDKLPVAIDTALLLLGACGLVLTVAGLVIAPFMLRTVLSVPESILPLAVRYFRIYALGLSFQFIYNGIAAILRGLGDSKAILFFLLIATVLNTILDLIFVIVFGWSVTGAAIATVAAQVVCMSVSYIYMRRRFPYVKAGDHWDVGICKTMTRLGLPIAIQQGLVAFGNGSMQKLVNGFGGTVPGVIAAFGAGIRMDSFIYVPILSFQSGLASFTGQNMGAGRLDRVKRGY